MICKTRNAKLCGAQPVQSYALQGMQNTVLRCTTSGCASASARNDKEHTQSQTPSETNTFGDIKQSKLSAIALLVSKIESSCLSNQAD